MTLTLSREPIANLRELGLDTLVQAHWGEVAHDRDIIPLDVDWQGYADDERYGRFLGLGLRRTGRLIGYNGFYVGPSRHYKSTLFAKNDVIYLKPEERGVDGLFMVMESERFLRALGVTKVFYHCKVDAILGSIAGDSLEAIENRLELEDRLGIQLPQDIETVGARTLAQVLSYLGYSQAENVMGKLLGNSGSWESHQPS